MNTSNPGKLAEFRRFLGAEVEALSIDLDEPEAEPETIVQYKASQFDGVLVDDTSLHIEGAEVGANVRWQLDSLHEYEGAKADFICLLGICLQSKVKIFEGRVKGLIVPPRGQGFGFNPVFQPDTSSFTLAERMEDQFNARYHAVQAFLKDQPLRVLSRLHNWTGEFQKK